MHALILEAEGFKFVIDPRDLWKPPRVIVRKGYLQAEIWLDETDISFMKPNRFSVREQTRILELVREIRMTCSCGGVVATMMSGEAGSSGTC